MGFFLNLRAKYAVGKMWVHFLEHNFALCVEAKLKPHGKGDPIGQMFTGLDMSYRKGGCSLLYIALILS